MWLPSLVGVVGLSIFDDFGISSRAVIAARRTRYCPILSVRGWKFKGRGKVIELCTSTWSTGLKTQKRRENSIEIVKGDLHVATHGIRRRIGDSRATGSNTSPHEVLSHRRRGDVLVARSRPNGNMSLQLASLVVPFIRIRCEGCAGEMSLCTSNCT